MPRKRHTPEQIISKLRQVEIELSKGRAVREAVKQIAITEQTYYRWRKEYGGLRLDQARRLKQLERENTRQKGTVANQAVDISILKETAEGNW